MKIHASAKYTLFSFLGLLIILQNSLCDTKNRTYRIKSNEEFILENDSNLYYLKPELGEYSNYIFDGDRFERQIKYRVVGLNKNTINAKEFLKENYLGTHLFLTKNINKEFITSSNVLYDYNGSIIQLIIRTDDSYTGYLTELFNTPFIWIPKSFNKMHQTDYCIGSDCISFVIYGKRRQNKNINYMPIDNIYNYTTDLFREKFTEKNGIYLTKNNTPVSTKNIKKDDLILFGPHIAVFYQDTGIIGVLDKDDLLIHSIGNGAHISTIEESHYYNYPIRVLRWNKF